MKTITVNGFVHLRTGPHCTKDDYVLLGCKIEDSTSYVYITEGATVFEVPDDFDPRDGQVMALKAEKSKAMADFQALVTIIDRKISELTALEFVA